MVLRQYIIAHAKSSFQCKSLIHILIGLQIKQKVVYTPICINFRAKPPSKSAKQPLDYCLIIQAKLEQRLNY